MIRASATLETNPSAWERVYQSHNPIDSNIVEASPNHSALGVFETRTGARCGHACKANAIEPTAILAPKFPLALDPLSKCT